MNHLDLFSGIGGFALAAQTVWGSDYHCVGFCEIDPFCQQVLRKNFEGVRIYGDIRGLTAERLAADTKDVLGNGGELYAGISNRPKEMGQSGNSGGKGVVVNLLTGGFPCQPFSTAGKRKGTEDDRFLWPEMLRVIREVKPRWVLGENVAGIIEMALGQVCAELEELDYEVQCFVIPACAVNAPHRRDRVWIVARANDRWGTELRKTVSERRGQEVPDTESGGRDSGRDCLLGEEQTTERGDFPSSDTCGEGLQGGILRRESEVEAETSSPGHPCAACDTQSKRLDGELSEGDSCAGGCDTERHFPNWSRDWREVAFESCVRGVDDGLPRRVARLPDGTSISESKWRQEALKAYGNSIVPEVAMELMKAIKAIDDQS